MRPALAVAIVSDHGFAPVSHAANISTAFVQAGLINIDARSKIVNWQAEPWTTGDSAAVYLSKPKDNALKARVASLLALLASKPENGISKVVDEHQIAALGGGKGPSFWIDFRLGYEPTNLVTGPMIAPSMRKGTHGYFPEHPEMNSVFMISGPGVPKARRLGQIDMRDIAPTLARILHVQLPRAAGKPLL